MALLRQNINSAFELQRLMDRTPEVIVRWNTKVTIYPFHSNGQVSHDQSIHTLFTLHTQINMVHVSKKISQWDHHNFNMHFNSTELKLHIWKRGWLADNKIVGSRMLL